MNAVARLAHADGKPRPYTATAEFAGVVWACGQVPTDEHGNVPEAIGDQVTVALDNLEHVLTAAGATLSSLLKLTVFLADFGEFDEYNEGPTSAGSRVTHSHHGPRCRSPVSAAPSASRSTPWRPSAPHLGRAASRNE